MATGGDPRILRLVVNGDSRIGVAEPRMLLVDFIRHELGLTGTHAGCEHGVCGACNVRMNGSVVRSCLVFAVQADGAEIETVESLAGRDGSMHPLQVAFQEHHGLQCGFCTPGFLVAGLEVLRDNPDPTEAEIRQALSGNLCRCTGYVGIVKAIRQAAITMRS
ncbi:MAG TPA: (2Fe-2S)-binding protein [Candidatus Dormibacteraeota bacterium]